MTKKQTHNIIINELNNCPTIYESSETVDIEDIQRERIDPPNNKETLPTSCTLIGNVFERDDLASSSLSASEDRVDISISPSQSSYNEEAKTISCRVCGSIINIEGKLNEHLVQCLKCHELTPVKKAPPGIKYGYCSCNCLAVVKGDLEHIKCLRPECGKIVNLNPSTTELSTENLPEVIRRIDCPNCMMGFKVRTRNRVYENCPRCGKGLYFTENKICSSGCLILYALVFAIATVIFVIMIINFPPIALEPIFYVFYVLMLIPLGFWVACCWMSRFWEVRPRKRQPQKNSEPLSNRENWERLMFYRRYV